MHAWVRVSQSSVTRPAQTRLGWAGLDWAGLPVAHAQPSTVQAPFPLHTQMCPPPPHTHTAGTQHYITCADLQPALGIKAAKIRRMFKPAQANPASRAAAADEIVDADDL